jgi:hypothetical protein
LIKSQKRSEKYADSKTGIWGNIECVQCGACCYELYERFGCLCPEQEIKNGKSYCKKHPFKEPLCADFFCNNMHEIVSMRLRKIAEILGTVPKDYKKSPD